MYRVEMNIGHKDCNGRALSAKQIIQAEYLALGAFVIQFPGAQIYRHPGAYCTHDSQVIVEPSTTVWAYTLNATPAIGLLSRVARVVAAMLHQESVLLVIIKQPGQMYWLHPKQADASGQKTPSVRVPGIAAPGQPGQRGVTPTDASQDGQ